MKEKDMFKLNGFIGVFIELILVIGIVLSLRSFILNGQTSSIILGIVLLFVFLLLATGFSIIQPNQAKVFTLFGNYLGVIKHEGFWFTVPLTIRKDVSLRVINFNS